MSPGYTAPARPEHTGAVCINSPHPEHAHACIRELVANYDFEAIFFDMTFWPTICYCSHCVARYWKEPGAEPPRIVDWKNPQWRTFQKNRKRWMTGDSLGKYFISLTHSFLLSYSSRVRH